MTDRKPDLAAARAVLAATGLVVEINCTGVWRTPKGSYSSMPFTRTSELAIYQGGVTISVEPPGAASVNYSAVLAWADIRAVKVAQHRRSTSVILAFDSRDPVVATLRASTERMAPVIEAMRTYSPPDL